MLDLRKRIFIITGMSVGITIALILLYLFIFKKAPADFESYLEPPVINGQVLDNTAPVQPLMPTIKPVVPANPDETYAKQIARMFVERFQSYSNQNENAHIDEALIMSTPQMALWLETQRKIQGKNYEGQTAKVLAARIIEFTSEKAVVEIDTQEVIVTIDSKQTLYRTGKVNLVKQNNDWKVDGLYWDTP